MKNVFSLVVLLLLGSWVYADPILLGDRHASYPVYYPLLLKDESGSMGIAEVLKKKDAFVQSEQKIVSLDVVVVPVWLKFDVRNNSTRSKWFIEFISPPLLHEVEVYVVSADGNYRSVKLVGDQHFGERLVKVKNMVVPIDLQPAEPVTFYVKVTSRNFMRIPFRIATMQELYESNHKMDVSNGLIFGMLIAFMIYNLFVFFSLRELTYLFYVGYVLFWGLNLVNYNGYLPDFIPNASGFNDSSVFIACSALCSVGFTNTFLQTRVYAPIINRTKWIMVLLCLIPIGFVVFGEPVYGFIYIQLMVYPVFVYWFVAGFMSFRNGYKPALYYIVGFGMYMVGSAIYNLKDHNLLPENIFTETSMHWGAAMEAVILSYALAVKLSFYKKEKEKIQQKALEQTRAFSQQVLETQETERKRIASELHDSVGQKLILLKNKILLLGKHNETQKEELRAVSGDVAQAIQEIRGIAYYLRPYQIDLFGISQALETVVTETSKATGIPISMEVDKVDGLFSKENEINVYRIVQELLNNMVKYAEATACSFTVKHTLGQVKIQFEDNGKGFDQTRVKKGLGLTGIQERVNILGGSFVISAAVPHGVMTTLTLPVNQ